MDFSLGGWSMLKVLIAEDDLTIADMIEACLTANGYQVTGIARTVAEAVALGRKDRPDLAILDMQLAGGGLGTEIPAQLRDGPVIGVLYASAHIDQVMAIAHTGACIAKPFHTNDLLWGLDIVAGISIAGIIPRPPLPRNFQLLSVDNERVGRS
jgi:DNA-binding response OmpR family regulator